LLAITANGQNWSDLYHLVMGDARLRLIEARAVQGIAASRDQIAVGVEDL